MIHHQLPSTKHTNTPISEGQHINIPTVLALNFPKLFSHFATFTLMLTQGKSITSVALRAELSKRHEIAHQEIKYWEEKRREIFSNPTLKKSKKDAALKKIREKRTRGMEVEAFYESSGHHKPIRVTLDELLDPEFHTTFPTCSKLISIAIRQGKFVAKFTPDEKKLNILAHQDTHHASAEHTLPGLFRDGVTTYFAIHALARTHCLEHDLPPGLAYIGRQSTANKRLSMPSLLLEQLGMSEEVKNGARIIKILKILSCITIYGEYASKTIEPTPIMKIHTRHVSAHDLPATRRTGFWAFALIPESIQNLQRNAFIQMPVALLKAKHTYTRTLGTLMLAHTNITRPTASDPSAHTFEMGRLMFESGLMQPFREKTSRDHKLLVTSLNNLQELDIITHIRALTGELVELLTHPNTSAPPPMTSPSSSELEESPPPKRRRRRRLPYKKLHISMYARKLATPPKPHALISQPVQGTLKPPCTS